METTINIEEECPICLSNILDTDAFLLLSCCNKKVHLHCLDQWYNNFSKKSKRCILCTKQSPDIENILAHSPIIESQRNSNNSNNNHRNRRETTLNNNNTNTWSNLLCIKCLFIAILLFPFIVFILYN